MNLVRPAAVVAALSAVALVLSGCSLLTSLGGGTSTVTTHTDEPVDSSLEPYYKQDVTWTGCGGGCGLRRAPMPAVTRSVA